MKTYENCPLKRHIQKFLWKGLPIQTKRILALSSPDFCFDYLDSLPGKYICDKNITFVNINPNPNSNFFFSKIVKNSLIGAFDEMVYNNKIPFFIDADFCRSIIGSGDDLIYLYNKCKKLNRNIYISFTFSIRGVGLEKTLKWIHDNFNVSIISNDSWRDELFRELILKDYKLKYREFVYIKGDCIHYRESGDQMITGLIRI